MWAYSAVRQWLISEAKQTGPWLWPTQRPLCECPRATDMAANGSSRQRKRGGWKKSWECSRMRGRGGVQHSDRAWPYSTTTKLVFTSRSSSDRARLRRLAERRLEARITPRPQNLEPCEQRQDTDEQRNKTQRWWQHNLKTLTVIEFQ